MNGPEHYSSKIQLFEKNVKTLKTSIKKLTSQLQKSQAELCEFKKKDRIFNLQKRCIDDSYKKVNLYSKKLN